MKVDIKSASGETLLSVGVNDGAKGSFSLMQHDYVELPFSLHTPVKIGIGSYADLRGMFDDALGGKLSKVYYVTEVQTPSYNTETGGYDYTLRLNAYYWLWNNHIFKYMPESTGAEVFQDGRRRPDSGHRFGYFRGQRERPRTGFTVR